MTLTELQVREYAAKRALEAAEEEYTAAYEVSKMADPKTDWLPYMRLSAARIGLRNAELEYSIATQELGREQMLQERIADHHNWTETKDEEYTQ